MDCKGESKRGEALMKHEKKKVYGIGGVDGLYNIEVGSLLY